MSPQLLEEIGLNSSQAKVYLTLVESGQLTPLEVAEKTGEKRTNAYMVLESLQKLGLIEENPKNKQKTYQANNPIALEKLSETRRQTVISAETRLKQALPDLLSYYYSFTEKPGVRLVQGIEGLKSIYQDTLRAKKDIHLLRTTADLPNISEDYLDKYRQKRAELGISTIALTPDTPTARVNAKSGIDEELLFKRTLLPKDSYTAPVEVDVYGTKTAFMMFGDEIMGVIVDSPALAEAMRQVFDLLHAELSKQP